MKKLTQSGIKMSAFLPSAFSECPAKTISGDRPVPQVHAPVLRTLLRSRTRLWLQRRSNPMRYRHLRMRSLFGNLEPRVYGAFQRRKRQFQSFSCKKRRHWLYLERVALVLQKKNNTFETDLFMPILEEVCKIAGVKYTGGKPIDEKPGSPEHKIDSYIKIICDHVRCVTFLVADGVRTSKRRARLRAALHHTTRCSLWSIAGYERAVYLQTGPQEHGSIRKPLHRVERKTNSHHQTLEG